MKNRLPILLCALPLVLTGCWSSCDPGIMGVFSPKRLPPPEETMWRERIARVKPAAPLDQAIATLNVSQYMSRERPPDSHRPLSAPPETEKLVAYFVEGGSIFIRYDGSDPAKKIVGIDFFRGDQTPAENLASWEALIAMAADPANRPAAPLRQP